MVYNLLEIDSSPTTVSYIQQQNGARPKTARKRDLRTMLHAIIIMHFNF